MIIVTGATGFIGSVIVWELNSRGITDIVCVDTVPPEERPGLLDNKKYNQFLLKDELWPFLETVNECKAVIHMGACSATTEMNRDFLRENNTEYTEQLFKWCTKKSVPFVYASSGAIYGDGKRGFDDASEPHLFQALNPYGESKLNFDIWAVQQKNTPPLWMGLRFFNVFGPNEYFKENMSSVVFKAYHQIKEAKSLKLFRSEHPDYKDGEQMRDFVYVKDITRWIAEIVLDGKGESGIYNMGFGQARTWVDLATAVFKELDTPVNIDWIDVPDTLKPRYQYFTEAKMDRFLAMGFTPPQWSLEKGVQDYVQTYLKNEEQPI